MAPTQKHRKRGVYATLWWLPWAAPEASAVGILVLATIGGFLGITQAWRLHQRRDRARRGLCTGCGNDLRASKGHCPECGQMVPIRTPTTLNHVRRESARARV